MRILEPAARLHDIVTRKTLLPPPETRADPMWIESWTHLAEVYTPAMVRYVADYLRRCGVDPEDAPDVVQAFVGRAMRSGQLASPQQDVRKFRAWITTQLRRHTNEHLDRVKSMKRGGHHKRRDADVLLRVPTAGDPSLASFDRGFVTIACQRALRRLQAGQGARKWGAAYAAIIQDLIVTDGEGSADLAERLGVRDDQLPNLKHRARQRFAEMFVGELRTTVRDDTALQDLLREIEGQLP